MWQSQVEIQHCSVAYFNHVTAIKAAVQPVGEDGGWGGGGGKGRGGVHTCSIDVYMYMYEYM